MKGYNNLSSLTSRIARLLALQSALVVSMGTYALPQGGNATNATIDNSVAGTVNINQSASRAVIEWNSYNIAAGETVRYTMPTGGAILNLINQGSASQINGNLLANGAVYLVNPHGILFGSSGRVEVGSLVASSLIVDKNEFLSGGALNFIGTTGGSIVNDGIIKAATGSVALLGQTVANNNVIYARQGSVTLASGTEMTLDFDGSGLIQVAVTGTVQQSGGATDAILNTGAIEGQNVALEARAAANIFTNAVNHQGLIRAKSFTVSGSGNIALVGEGAPVTIAPGAVVFAENGLTVQELPGSPVAPPPAPPAPPSGSPGSNGNSDDNQVDFSAALASSVNPVEGSESASVTSSVVGLYSVEGEGIRLPADQMEEPL